MVGMLAALLIGCAGPDGKPVQVDQVVTPERVKAVVTWGTYAAARSQLPSARSELERAQAGLESLQLSGTYDVPAIASALKAGGITWLSTTEGTLTIAAVMSFQDLFHDVVQPISTSQYTKAVLDGALAGLQLALAAERSLPAPVGTDAQWIALKTRAEASR